ncbi:PilZ domain-containing protein [Rhizobacter sp. SG703]|uniref:PilZ domain-containing protein n=1 Tax=Rhizobacter sp. SG703 TaxID=2587140 RepID=UPI001444A4E6|nr:PilZ domain-containing protein [Rhizobacter sp. SG703]NKI95692.1 hypothetical protein [Rhizobacter sp. SG703]
MRQFIRHPVDLPVQIGAENLHGPAAAHAHDISAGGLAVHVDRAVAPGAHVRIRIPYVQPAFEADARVAWCEPSEIDGYELGVTFLDAEVAFLARMVEQVCHIEDYRQSVGRIEGRQLTAEEAAMEWIERYAGEFPAIAAGRPH